MHALIIEDEPALQVFYERVLQKVDYTVSVARDGSEAITWLQDNPTPKLILLDIRLPGINGVAVAQHISNTPDLHTAHVVIASASQEFEKFVGELPSADFLLKPVLPAQLMEIANIVAGREPC